MLNRISHFFNSRRRKSSSKQRTDSETSLPSPPLSPCSLQSEDEDELKTPTPSRKDRDISLACSAFSTTEPEHCETLSQSSGQSTSSIVSLVKRQEEDSRSITPKTLDLPITPRLDSNSEHGFPGSRGQDTWLQSSVGQRSTEDKTVNQTAPSQSKGPLSEVSAAQTAPKSLRSNASANDSTVKNGEKQHGLNQKDTACPPPALGLTHQANEECPDTPGTNTGANQRELRHSCGQEHAPGTICPFCPLQLHKARVVEAYLREEKEGAQGDHWEGIPKDWQQDMPLVLAVPVVISEDSHTQDTADIPEDTLSPTKRLRQPSASQDPQTSLVQTNGPNTSHESKPGTPQEKHTSGEVCVTRKTVNLPSKHKQRARGTQGHHAWETPAKQTRSELPVKMAETAGLQR